MNDADRLTLTIKGLSPESSEAVISLIEQGIDGILAYYRETGCMQLNAPDLIDAEKFYMNDYDFNLCWAATAANMLWTSNYAQQAVNPATGSNFQTVDEVFDYFRKAFLDDRGNTNVAFSLFFYGTDAPDDAIPAADWMKEDIELPALLPDEADPQPYGFESILGEFPDISAFESLDEMSISLVLHGLWRGTSEYTGFNHSVTLSGLVFDEKEQDPRERYKAVIIADSDNDPGIVACAGADPFLVPYAERARLAADAPNRYQLFPLNLVDCGEHIGLRWSIPFFLTTMPEVVVVIDAYTWLRDKVLPMPDEDVSPEEPDEPVTPDEQNTPDHQEKPFVPESVPYGIPVQKPDLPDYDFTAIREMMKESDWLIYSPTDWRYDTAADNGFHVFVRITSDMLLNVYLDGERISAVHKDFVVFDAKTGIILLSFSEEYLKQLGPGEHILRIQIAGYGEVSATIIVS